MHRLRSSRRMTLETDLTHLQAAQNRADQPAATGPRPSQAGVFCVGTARANQRLSVSNRGIMIGTKPASTSRAKPSMHSSSVSA